jgi:hypothetical protein
MPLLTCPPAPAPLSFRPPAALLLLALRLLHTLAGTAACAWGAAAHGGALYLLTLLLPAYQGARANGLRNSMHAASKGQACT